MEFARQYVDAYAEVFKGNQTAHGVHIPENKVKKGEKAKGKSFTRREKLTADHILKHLHGEESIGVNPLNHEGKVNFVVIDVDVYPVDPTHYLAILKRAGLPFIGFRSKSGGLHLYLFFSSAVLAAKVLPLMQTVRQILGLPKDTEIFPKQTRLIGDQIGNWINLPYFDYTKPVRQAYSFEGDMLSLTDALTAIQDSKVSFAGFEEAIAQAPLSEAPPCLQTIFMHGGAEEGSRNCYLFNCAIYLKARFGKDFAENLHALNKKTLHPIEYEELDRTVVASHNKGDYSYQCQDPGLSQYCDKALCILRTYGKGAGTVSDLSFEKLVQVQCSTPYYKWYVNGAEMIFYSESELMNQQKFREMCLRFLHKVPNQLKNPAWDGVLNRALANIELEIVEAEDDMSEDSLWLSKVLEFFSRPQAMRPSQVEDGLVWQSEDNELHFKGAKLLEYLDKTNLFRHFKKAQHRDLIDKLGAKNTKLRYTDLGKAGRTWALNLFHLHEKGLFLEISKTQFDEKDMTPLDFIGEEKF